MFCVFREFCGSKYLCKSVKSVGEYPLPVCSVCSENSVGGFNIGALSDMLVHFLLWQAAKPIGDKCTPGRRKFIVEKKLPQISRIYTDVSKMFCVFREFCGSKYLCKSAFYVNIQMF